MAYRFLRRPIVAMTLAAAAVWVFNPGSLKALQEEEKAEVKQEAEEEQTEEEEVTFASIKLEYDDAVAEFGKAYRDAEDQEAKQKVFAEMYPRKEQYVDKVFALIEDDPASDEAGDALGWLLAGLRDKEAADKVTGLLLEHHIDSEIMETVAANMVYAQPSPDTESCLRKILKESPHDAVKGKTAYYLIRYLDRVEQVVSNADRMKQLERTSPDEVVDYLKSKSSEALSADFNELAQLIRDEYNDIALRGNVTIGDKLEGMVFEKENLQIGMKAPDIEGEDIDGTEFKLSDYLGKVVVIDFWGDW